MNIRATIQTLLAGGTAVLLFAHCGGSTSTAAADAGPHADGSSSGGGLDSGMCEGTAGQGEVPGQHRPTASPCARTPNATDACLADSDCGSADVCVCTAGAGGGLRSAGNVCVAASCKVDSDCGSGNLCVPSRGYCGSVEGFYCTSNKDTCVDPAKDCSCGGNSCVYAPMVGHFVCGTSVCMG